MTTNLLDLNKKDLVLFHNELTTADFALKPKAKISKGKIIKKIEALQAAASEKDDEEVPVASTNGDKPPRGAIRDLAYSLLEETDDDGVGISYDEMLTQVLDVYPTAKTTVGCLRWYSAKIKSGGGTLPDRPRKARVKKPSAKCTVCEDEIEGTEDAICVDCDKGDDSD